MEQSQAESVKQKSKQQYSRNVKKLKFKLKNIQAEILTLQSRIQSLSNTSNDKIIAMKIGKFAKERNFTPQMIFRFCDKNNKGIVSKIQFKQCLNQIGLKLTTHQIMRLEYLLDQDLSGSISKIEFDSYLSSFGIKKQYSGQDPLIKNALAKLDLNKIKKLADQKDDMNIQKKKKKNLVDYQQFLKYCHKNIPQLSNKELAIIFNRLKKNQYVDLDELIAYLEQRQKENQRLKKKNQKKISKQAKQNTQVSSLKDIIKYIIQHRQKQSKGLFHSSQFQRLGKKLVNKKKQLLMIFKRIDKKKKGSFGYNQIIADYLQFQGTKDMKFPFQLMGRKIITNHNKPQDIISVYNSGSETINNKQFESLMNQQFQVPKVYIEKLFRTLNSNPNQSIISVKTLLEAMSVQGDAKRIVYIKPPINFDKKGYYKSDTTTIFLDPYLALRSCIVIAQQLTLESNKMWNDYEFGETFADPSGQSFINMSLQSDKVKWIRTEQLNQNQFFFQENGYQFQIGSQTIHSLFVKAVFSLVESDVQLLWSRKKLDYSKRNVEENDLIPLFSGLYPLVFHQFAKFGMYVFKFFSKERWVYVLIDNKIPCHQDNKIMFSSTKTGKHSWISLIEKAFAKLIGNYSKLFEINSTEYYIYSLSRMLYTSINIPSKYKNQQQKKVVWNLLRTQQNNNNIYATNNQSIKQIGLTYQNIVTGIQNHKLLKIQCFVQLEDQKCNNLHKSHRIIGLKQSKLQNEKKWNQSWHSQIENNKYNNFMGKIQLYLKTLKNKLTLKNNLFFINFKLFRNLFNSLVNLKKPNWNTNVILRKRIQFQQNFKCNYYLKSESKNKLTISLNKIRSSSNAIILFIQKSNGKIIRQCKIKGLINIFQVQLINQESLIQLSINNWQKGQQYIYSLTFTFDNHQYYLKERDRHLLFDRISMHSQQVKLQMSQCNEKQKGYIVKQFYKNSQRGRICCC